VAEVQTQETTEPAAVAVEEAPRQVAEDQVVAEPRLLPKKRLSPEETLPEEPSSRLLRCAGKARSCTCATRPPHADSLGQCSADLQCAQTRNEVCGPDAVPLDRTARAGAEALNPIKARRRSPEEIASVTGAQQRQRPGMSSAAAVGLATVLARRPRPFASSRQSGRPDIRAGEIDAERQQQVRGRLRAACRQELQVAVRESRALRAVLRVEGERRQMRKTRMRRCRSAWR